MAISSIKNFLITQLLKTVRSQNFLSIQLDITNACNLNCSHCYHSHHKNKGAINLSQWKEIIDQYDLLLQKLILKPRIVICGGEPLVSPMLLPLIEYINHKWPKTEISILTNGTTINRKLLEKLIDYNVEFQVSIDGPDSNRHDEIRGAGNFLKALSGIKLSQQYGIRVAVLTVLSKKTSFWIYDFFDLAKTIGVCSMNFTRFIPQGNGYKLVENGLDRALTAFELKESFTKIYETGKLLKVKTGTNQPLFHLVDSSLGSNGNFGFQGIVVDYKGNFKISSRADYIIGNILETGLENLFLKNPIMKELRKGNIEKCGSCVHYSRCGGDRNISFAETGSFLKADSGCWFNLESTSIDLGGKVI